MATRRRRTAGSLLAATLIASACGGGGNDIGDDGSPSGSGDGTAQLASVELVWALDGEPVGSEFDYTEPIARDRYDAGLRLDAVFETTGDVGGATTEIFLRTRINGDTIDGAVSLGPERSPTRPDREDMIVVQTDRGFVAQFPIGRPLSPISLVDARQRFIESGLDPDDEVIEFEDSDIQVNAASLLDYPEAPQNGHNEFVIELFGTVEFDNGFVLEIGEDVARSEIGERLSITETSTVSISTVGDCAAQTERYLQLLDEELADSDSVLLDRIRAFGRIAGIQRDNDCGVRDFDIPVCEAATAATAPESVLGRHLRACPDARQLAEATVFEPRFDDGVVRLVVPSTADGLPAYSIVMSFPAWTIETTSEGATRQKIALSADPETAGRFTRLDIDVSAMPASLLDDRAAATVELQVPGAEVLLADTTTVGGVAARRLIAQLEPGSPEFQVGTAVEIDSERLLTITGVVMGTEQLPVDGDGLAALMACVEASMVIVEYEADVDPAPAGDCSEITELSFGDPPPDAAAERPPPFDGSTISLTVPVVDELPAHVVTLSAPPWTLGSVRETDSTQSVKVDADEQTATFISATVDVTTDFQTSSDEAAAPPFDDWTIVSDEIRTLGERSLRIVVSDWEGQDTRRGTIITQVDERRVLIVEVNIDGPGDFDAIFGSALDSLDITP